MEIIDIFHFEGKFGARNEPTESGYFETKSEEDQKIFLKKAKTLIIAKDNKPSEKETESLKLGIKITSFEKKNRRQNFFFNSKKVCFPVSGIYSTKASAFYKNIV